MTLWRLEWLRLVRTRRLVAVVGVYLFFGLSGPISARYLGDILGRVDTQGVRVELPEPVPADGVAQFIGNASQIGLLVVVLVAASALAFDARREMAIFLRTRVTDLQRIVLPAYGVTTGAAVVGLVLGSLAAWYETAVLLGGLPVLRMVVGILLGALFLAFGIAVVALVAAFARGVLATAGASLAVLVALALLGNIGALGRWLPTSPSGAMVGLVSGRPYAEFLPGAAVAIVCTVLALVGATRIGSRREV